MQRKKKSKLELLKYCAEIGDEDGNDPKLYFALRAHHNQKTNRKALQLARQIFDTLQLVLGDGTVELQHLDVLDVSPAPDSRRMRVVLRLNSSAQIEFSKRRILEVLKLNQGRLRAEIARSIHRKKTPTLVFDVCEDYSAGGRDA